MTRFALAGALAGAVFVAAAIGFSRPAQSTEGARGIGDPGPAFTADYLCNPHKPDLNIRDIKDDFKAEGDGIADDYAAIQRGADWVSETDPKNPGTYKVLVYPPGTYKIDRVYSHTHITAFPEGDPNCALIPAEQPYCYGAEIDYKGLNNVRIQGCHAKIVLKGDFYQPADMGSASSLSTVIPFRIFSSSKFTVDGLEIYGGADKSSRDPILGESGGVGIITYGCDHYQLSNLNIHLMQQDGVHIGADVSRLDTGFTLDHIFSEHNARCALCVGYARNGTFTELDLGYTGCTGFDPDPRTCSISDTYRGIDFMEGVDIEPDLVAREKTGDLTFDHVNIHDNLGFIFSATSGAHIEDITIQNSTLTSGKGAYSGADQVVIGVNNGLIKDSKIDLPGVDKADYGEILNRFFSKFLKPGKIDPEWSETSLTIQRTEVRTSGWGLQSDVGDGINFGTLTVEDSHFIGSQPPEFCGYFPYLPQNPLATISRTKFEYPAGWSNGNDCGLQPGQVGHLNIGASTGNTFTSSFATPGVTCIQYGGTATPAPADTFVGNVAKCTP